MDILLQTDRATLSEFHHPVAHEHADPDVEVASCDSVNFVDGGTFDVTMSGESRRIDPGMVFLAVGGMSFSCRHQDAIPTDRCLTVAYADDAVEELRRADLPGLAPPAIPLSACLTILRHRLRGCAPMDDIRFDLVGFCSLSHFVTAFRRRYGIVPNAVRRGAPLPVLRASLSTPVWADVSR